MLKKMIILAVALCAVLSSQSIHALSWGKIDGTPDKSISYVERYGLQQVKLSIEYQPYFFGMMPAYVEISVEGSPSWLTVVASPRTVVLNPGVTKDIYLITDTSGNGLLSGDVGSETTQNPNTLYCQLIEVDNAYNYVECTDETVEINANELDITVDSIAAASVTNPDSGTVTMFRNSNNSDHLSIKKSSGITVDLETSGANYCTVGDSGIDGASGDFQKLGDALTAGYYNILLIGITPMSLL